MLGKAIGRTYIAAEEELKAKTKKIMQGGYAI